MKKLEFDFWPDQEIVLIDDSVITGHHLKSAYDMVKRKITEAKIIPYVFAMEEKWNDANLRRNDEIFKNLRYERVYTHNEILKLSSIESLLFYECGIPYMVEFCRLLQKREACIRSAFFQRGVSGVSKGR